MEIERKFLIKAMPDLLGITPVRYERYYLKREAGVEERIQKKGTKFEHEKKTLISTLERTREKREISEEEFLRLKKEAGEAIVRDGYGLGNNTSIKIYHGRFEGLLRVEIEFATKEDALAYKPEQWMGDEITASPLGRDSTLLDLSESEFLSLVKK
ncbi:MAG: hypothetical protein RL097_224 [Candidatus Parcubacteria bacterium]|jgi:adenylate cyclase